MDLDFTAMTVGLLGGLALFLLGMDIMTDALRLAAGGGLRDALRRLTSNRFTGAATGAIVTAVIQSSSAATVLIVGFVSAGLMTFQQSVAVVLGANVGTTVTAQIVAFKVTDFALAMIAIGFLAQFAIRAERWRRGASILLGLGLVFFGMKLMGEATGPLVDYEPFTRLMAQLHVPALSAIVGALFTAVVQSSSATTALVIVLASAGLLTLEAGIGLIIGANVGTCVTAALASLGKPVDAKRVAIVHVLFNLAGAALWLPLIGVLAGAVTTISPSRPDLEGAVRLAAETPRQVANAHTIFNVANALIFIWLTGPLARLAVRVTPTARALERAEPRYLDESLLATPAIAVERVLLEIVRMGDVVVEAVRAISLDAHDHEGERRVDRVRRAVQDVEALDRAILAYARRLLARSIPAREAERLEAHLAAALHIQSVADLVGVNLARIAEQWRERGLRASDETARQARELHAAVAQAVEDGVRAFRENDAALARDVVGRKATINALADALNARITARLRAESPDRVEIYRRESEVIEILRHVYYFAKRLARVVAGESGSGPPLAPAPATGAPSAPNA